MSLWFSTSKPIFIHFKCLKSITFHLKIFATPSFYKKNELITCAAFNKYYKKLSKAKIKIHCSNSFFIWSTHYQYYNKNGTYWAKHQNQLMLMNISNEYPISQNYLLFFLSLLLCSCYLISFIVHMCQCFLLHLIWCDLCKYKNFLKCAKASRNVFLIYNTPEK